MVVIADTKNGRSEFANKYLLKRNKSYLLVLDHDGKELSQYSNKLLEFDDETIKNIEAVGAEYRIAQKVLVEYLLTWINSTLIHQSQIENLVSQLDSPRYATRESASQSLESLGEPTYQFFLNHEPADAESQSRLRAIGKILKSRRDIIVRDGLDHNVQYLAKHAINNPDVLAHLRQILPETLDIDEIEQWWKDNGQRYDWDAEEKQFVLQDVGTTSNDDRSAGEKGR